MDNYFLGILSDYRNRHLVRICLIYRQVIFIFLLSEEEDVDYL